MLKSKLKFCHLEFVLCHYFVICALSLVILTSGCATIAETAKGIAGISTKAIEDSRSRAIVKTFNYDYANCVNKTKEILKSIDAYIYTEDTKKGMIAIYVSSEDTTPVGLFFKGLDKDKTQLEVSSPSTYAKELIAKRVSSNLEKSLNPVQKEGKSDAKE